MRSSRIETIGSRSTMPSTKRKKIILRQRFKSLRGKLRMLRARELNLYLNSRKREPNGNLKKTTLKTHCMKKMSKYKTLSAVLICSLRKLRNINQTKHQTESSFSQTHKSLLQLQFIQFRVLQTINQSPTNSNNLSIFPKTIRVSNKI